MNKKWLVYVMILVVGLLCCLPQSMVYADVEERSVDVLAPSKAMAVMEASTQKLLYGSAENMKLPMASTTKITTCIVAIENAKDINEMVAIHPNAVGIEGTSIYLKKGEVMSLKDLLLGLMLASGNDASVAIAYHIGGTEKNFVKMMNDYALSVGAYNTHYDNPHGLDSDTHYTTARDLALITSKALENDIFREIASTKYATIKGNDEVANRYLKHKNKLLFEDESCIGVKTGFTDNAGRCLVSASKRDHMTIVSVVLNCGPMFDECRRLTNMAFNEYEYQEFVKPYTYMGELKINHGDCHSIGVSTIEGFSDVVKKNECQDYQVVVDLPSSMDAPIQNNQVVGVVKVLKGQEIVYEGDLVSIKECKNTDFRYTLDNVIEKWYN